MQTEAEAAIQRRTVVPKVAAAAKEAPKGVATAAATERMVSSEAATVKAGLAAT